MASSPYYYYFFFTKTTNLFQIKNVRKDTTNEPSTNEPFYVDIDIPIDNHNITFHSTIIKMINKYLTSSAKLIICLVHFSLH